MEAMNNMKRTLTAFSIILLITACSTKDFNLSTDIFNPVFEGGFENLSTRVYVDGNLKPHWDKGDRVSIFTSTLNDEYLFAGETGDEIGTFNKVNTSQFGTGLAISTNYAFYPYNASTKFIEEGVFSISFPQSQVYAENTFAKESNTMAAVTESKDSQFLPFKNLCGYLIFELFGSGKVSSITIKGNDHEKLSGGATVSIGYGSDPSVTMSETAEESIVLNCGEGMSLGEDKTSPTRFWVTLPPTVFKKGFIVDIETSGGNISSSMSKNVEIKRNTAYRMQPLEISAPSVIPVGSITLDLDEISITEGNDTQLSYVVLPENATDKTIVWTSSDESVAKVDETGTVHAVSPGIATITASSSDGKQTATCIVTVTAYVPVTDISIDKTSINVLKGKTALLTARVLPANATHKTVQWNSSNNEVCTVSENGLVKGITVGEATVTVTSLDPRAESPLSARCTVIVTSESLPEAVDMGSSKILWASFNLGADSPSRIGKYYAWAETTVKSSYTFSNYKWGDGIGTNGYERYTKYVNNVNYGGVVDKLFDLEPDDDAAHVALGGKWRTPTPEEWEALLKSCTITEKTVDGIKGVKLIMNNSPYNSLFFPYTGYKEGSNTVGTGFGYYWTNHGGYKNRPNYAAEATLRYDSDYNNTFTHVRYHGLVIRAVCDK